MNCRPLGYFETLLYFGHQRGISQMTLTATLQGKLNKQLFLKAFHLLFQRHPMLRSTVICRDELLYYEFNNDFCSIPIDYYHENDNKVAYQTLFDTHVNQQLPLDKHNWSVAIIESVKGNRFDLIWHLSHVIADGLSYINLMQELLTNLDALILGEGKSTASLPVYDKVEAYLLQKISIPNYFDHLQRKTQASTQVTLSPLPVEKRANKAYIIKQISNEDLNQLKKITEKNNITLNNLINAALAKAYVSKVNVKNSLTIGSAINLRNKSLPKIPKNICGNYFSSLLVTIENNELDKSIDKLAKVYKNRLGHAINQHYFLPTDYKTLNMQQTVKDFMLRQEKKRQEQLSSSYLGNIDISTQNIELQQFMIYPKHADGNNVITTIFNDTMRMMFCFAPEYREISWADELADRVIENLMMAITQ
jgi:Condensation domain